MTVLSLLLFASGRVSVVLPSLSSAWQLWFIEIFVKVPCWISFFFNLYESAMLNASPLSVSSTIIIFPLWNAAGCSWIAVPVVKKGIRNERCFFVGAILTNIVPRVNLPTLWCLSLCSSPYDESKCIIKVKLPYSMKSLSDCTFKL